MIIYSYFKIRNHFQLSFRRGFDTFYGSYLGVLDHFTHVRDKYEGYDFHKDEKVLFNASGRCGNISISLQKNISLSGTELTSMETNLCGS